MKIVLFICLFLITNLNANFSLITPIPQKVEYDKQKALLGKRLFFDTIMSYDRAVSCESCHELKDDFTGTQNKAFSMGALGHKTKQNTPTIMNVSLNVLDFWETDSMNLNKQVVPNKHNEYLLGTNAKTLISRLTIHPEYRKIFSQMFPDGVSMKNVISSISEFLKALITPDSRFDQYLRGDLTSMSIIEVEGYRTFQKLGCIACHNGVNLGGNSMQTFGHFKGINKKNFEVKKLQYLKVPILRNIVKTAPYYHDGSVNDLREAIAIAIKEQLGIQAQKEDIESIYNFFTTLNGNRPSILNEK